MSSRCRRTPGSSSSGWKSPTSTDRRHLPGDRHPAEEQHPQSALDGGTTTEIHDYMRLLYARIGRRSAGMRPEVVRETAEVVAHALADAPEGTRLISDSTCR